MIPPEFHIRPAKEDDIDALLDLIKELAKFEKVEGSAKATKEQLKQNLLTTSTPYAHALLAISPDGQAVGYTMYHFNYSTWTGRPGIYMIDLFVKEEYRSKGVGKAFFGKLAKIAKEKNCARIDWIASDWNARSLHFYQKTIGASELKGAICMRLDEHGIEELDKFNSET